MFGEIGLRIYDKNKKKNAKPEKKVK